MIARKQLVVNADDFGFTPDVNEGIVEAHRHGILTATTLMANGAAFDDAVRLARETPSLDIGCHLVLIGGGSLVTGKPLPCDRPAVARRAGASRDPAVRGTGARRSARSSPPGFVPTHLDTHKHTHLAPPVLDAVARLARGVRHPLGAAAVRFPADCAARRRARA